MRGLEWMSFFSCWCAHHIRIVMSAGYCHLAFDLMIVFHFKHDYAQCNNKIFTKGKESVQKRIIFYHLFLFEYFWEKKKLLWWNKNVTRKWKSNLWMKSEFQFKYKTPTIIVWWPNFYWHFPRNVVYFDVWMTFQLRDAIHGSH